MEKIKDTIYRQAAIELADKLKDDFPDDEKIADGVIAHNEGILEYQTALSLLPSAEPEYLYIVMDKVKKHLEKAMSMYYIRNPMAWALYETWKEYDK